MKKLEKTLQFLMIGMVGYDILPNSLKQEKIFTNQMELLLHWQQEL
jgi:hypothetical protein